MIRKQILPDAKVAVTFEMPASIWADTIHLVGDFNEWNRASHPLRQRHSDGIWEINLVLDAGREYQYRYLVNATDWHTDWQADRATPNPYGSENSVVVT
ncbi:MAG: isoamylase early set domain-containing protein [Chloroflexi bacterium]|nr:isoamylase early set domain-containing protein [Chloroflexota bacterium]MBI3733320.1 isoamylase early set domain-containing protein [Chloroflexota bacterium]